MNTDLVYHFIKALKSGKVCLHPTDTLPGLSFDPSSKLGWEALLHIKKRKSTSSRAKPFVSLIHRAEQARKLWKPLPATWDQAVSLLWPGPLTLIWKASLQADPQLVSEDGTLSLRLPI